MQKSSGNSLITSKELRFSCVRCSACCRFEPGYVFLSGKDISLLRSALNMETGEFIKAYCRWIPSGENGKFQLSLREKSNNDCIFWKQEKGCSVYSARPLQCRAFPFWSSVVDSKKNWEMAAHSCPGMNQGMVHSADSIQKWLAMRINEPIISRGEF